jgi:hypothetical protein
MGGILFAVPKRGINVPQDDSKTSVVASPPPVKLYARLLLAVTALGAGLVAVALIAGLLQATA